MNRQTRTLLIVTVIAVAGVSALAYIARQYSRIEPVRSVMDLKPQDEISFLDRDPAPGGEAVEAGESTDATTDPGIEPAAARASAETETAAAGAVTGGASVAPVAQARGAAVEEPVRPTDPATPSAAGTAVAAAVEAPPPTELSDAERRVQGFIASRRSIQDILDRAPVARRVFESQAEETVLQKEPPSRIFNRVLIDIKIDRMRSLGKFGMEGKDHAEVKQAYDAWKAGDGSVEPELAAAFANHSAELAELDVPVIELLDN